jgi:DNA-binding CsgD family transcriptional regulator
MHSRGPIEVSVAGVNFSERASTELALAVELECPEGDLGDDEGSRRKARVRARTISIKRLSKRELERGKLQFPDLGYERPRTRGDCQHGPHAERPCPFVSCKHHLYLDVNDRTGSIKLNFPDMEVWELPETCALDIADRGGITLEEVGEIMNLTRERIRQLETRGLAKLKALGEMAALSDYCE